MAVLATIDGLTAVAIMGIDPWRSIDAHQHHVLGWHVPLQSRRRRVVAPGCRASSRCARQDWLGWTFFLLSAELIGAASTDEHQELLFAQSP